MDTIVFGKKGSGKSYYAAYHINKLKEPDKVLHNVDGLKLGLNINDEAERLGIKPMDFFRDSLHNDTDSPLHDERFLKYRGFLFVIDEAADIFPTNFKDPDVMKFFRMSRHYVIDCILLTQDVEDISKSIYKKAEMHIKAVPDVANPFPGYLLYHEMSGREKVGNIKLRKKKEIFESYKSADYNSASPRKTKKPMQLLLVGTLIVSICCAGGFIYFMKGRLSKNKQTRQNNQESNNNSLSTHQENNKNYQERNRGNQNNNSSGSVDSFPLSFEYKLEGVFLPISTFRDHSGHYGILLGIAYKLVQFPYPVHESRFGYVALVPLDLFEYASKLKKDSIDKTYPDPNLNYYYNDSNKSTLASSSGRSSGADG